MPEFQKETRKRRIDQALRQAGWEPETQRYHPHVHRSRRLRGASHE